MAYCLSLLSYTNEKSLQKLIECFKLFADALADDEVAEFFSNIVEETRKNAAAVQQPATAACLLIILYYYFSNYLFSHNQKYISRFFCFEIRNCSYYNKSHYLQVVCYRRDNTTVLMISLLDAYV